MSFTSGTATDMNDLLSKLRTYMVTTVGTWTSLSWSPGATATDPSTFYAQGNGPDASRRVYVQMETEYDVGNNIYALKTRMATGYDSGLDWANQPGAGPGDVYSLGWASSMDYWFYVNARRIIVVIKVNTTYSSLYAGMFLPWATASEYDFPYYYGGDSNEAVVYTDVNTRRNHFIRPSYTGAWWRDWAGSWGHVDNQQKNQTDSNRPQASSRGFIWPQGFASANLISTFPLSWSGKNSAGSGNGWMDFLQPTVQGDLPVFPCLLGLNISDTAVGNAGLVGGLDGAWTAPGVGVTAGQTITFDSRTFRLFPNVFRLDGSNWMAVEEV